MPIENIKVDKMRYQNNSSAYNLVLLAMVFQIISLFATITPPLVTPTLTTTIEILLNVFLLLVTFLAAEKAKTYSRNWGITLMVIAGIHLTRIFGEPLKLQKLNELTTLTKHFNLGFIKFDYPWNQYVMIIVEILILATLLVIAGAITLKKNKALVAHLKGLGE